MSFSNKTNTTTTNLNTQNEKPLEISDEDMSKQIKCLNSQTKSLLKVYGNFYSFRTTDSYYKDYDSEYESGCEQSLFWSLISGLSILDKINQDIYSGYYQEAYAKILKILNYYFTSTKSKARLIYNVLFPLLRRLNDYKLKYDKQVEIEITSDYLDQFIKIGKHPKIRRKLRPEDVNELILEVYHTAYNSRTPSRPPKLMESINKYVTQIDPSRKENARFIMAFSTTIFGIDYTPLKHFLFHQIKNDRHGYFYSNWTRLSKCKLNQSDLDDILKIIMSKLEGNEFPDIPHWYMELKSFELWYERVLKDHELSLRFWRLLIKDKSNFERISIVRSCIVPEVFISIHNKTEIEKDILNALTQICQSGINKYEDTLRYLLHKLSA